MFGDLSGRPFRKAVLDALTRLDGRLINVDKALGAVLDAVRIAMREDEADARHVDARFDRLEQMIGNAVATRRLGFNIVGLVPRDPTGGIPMLEVSCDTESKVRIRVVPKTKSGAPAAIQTGSLSVVTQSGDGTFALEDDVTFTVQGTALADSSYLVSGDADLGDGVVTISDTILLHTTGAMAENLGLTQVEVVPR